MYRFLLAFLVFSSIALSITTIVWMRYTDKSYQDYINRQKTATPTKLGDSQVGNMSQNVELVYKNRAVTHGLGIAAGIVALFFLYKKSLKSTKFMYFPLLVSAAAGGMFIYNLVALTTSGDLEKVQQQEEQSINQFSTSYQDGKYRSRADTDIMQASSLYLDISASAVGILAQLGTIVYLINRRI
jgi:hypothetical protein